MSDKSTPASSGFSVQDILLALFKHKWKIIFFTVLGLGAAAAFYFWHVPMYESQAKLLVRYVDDSPAVGPDATAPRGPTRSMDSIINSEVEILTSWDLAMKAAAQERLVELNEPPAAGEAEAAAQEKRMMEQQPTKEAAVRIRSGLTVTPRKGTNIIIVSYSDPQPARAPEVLKRLVKAYFAKHFQVHSLADINYAKEKESAARRALGDLEKTLSQNKAAANMLSVEERAASLTKELGNIQGQLLTAEAELAELEAKIRAMGGSLPDLNPSNNAAASAGATPNTPGPQSSHDPALVPKGHAPNTVVQEYQSLAAQLTRLRQKAVDLGAKWKPGHPEITANDAQIEALQLQQRRLEEKFPDLAARVPVVKTAGNTQGLFDLPTEQARWVGLKAKVNELKKQREALKKDSQTFAESASAISGLERDKGKEEESLKYFSGRVQKAQVDAELKDANISEAQAPSPASQVNTSRNKIMGGLAGAGMGLGIGIALLLELLLNRTIKRPLELPSRLHIPLMLAIPRISRNGSLRLTSAKPRTNGRTRTKPSVAPWDHNHFIRPYSEVIRDRLAMFFELHGLVHKPKLIGVAGFSEGAGASTLAGGLAASLSETGDGKVLLVDLNVGQGEAHSFFKGRPAYPLATAIKSSRDMDSAAENLYLASVNQEEGTRTSRGLRKLHTMLSGFKASEYDYIVFDMPSVGQMSPTMTLAAHMDKMLLVVEAEKNDRDVVRRRHSELVATDAKLSVIFNKARHYGPRWLEAEA